MNDFLRLRITFLVTHFESSGYPSESILRKPDFFNSYGIYH